MRKGAEAYNNGDLANAVRAYDDALRANPSSTMARLHISFVLLRQDDSESSWKRVRKLSSEVLQVEPRNDNAEWNLALIDTLQRNSAGAFFSPFRTRLA